MMCYVYIYYCNSGVLQEFKLKKDSAAVYYSDSPFYDKTKSVLISFCVYIPLRN